MQSLESTSHPKGRLSRAVFVGLLLLGAAYAAGKLLLGNTELELRFWADALGFFLLVYALPFLALVRFFIWRFKAADSRARRVFVEIGMLFAAGGFLLWSYIGIIIGTLSLREERTVMPGLLAVEQSGFLEETAWLPYEPVGLIFRRRTTVTADRKLQWLNEKYGREFCKSSGTELLTDAERPEVAVTVRFVGGKLQDDYIDRLTEYYLKQGYGALGLTRESGDQAGQGWYLVLEDGADLWAFSKDASALMTYVKVADAIFADYRAWLWFRVKELEGENGQDTALLPIGEPGALEEWDADYYASPQKVCELVREKYERLYAWSAQAANGKQDTGSGEALQTGQEDDAVPPLSESQIAELAWPEQAEAARSIYDTFLEKQGFQYEARCNAKGNFYVSLGQAQEGDFYLRYDRESRNEKCYLFVLTERDGGYADEKLKEFYAVEKETGKAVAGNRTAWEQTACAEYRELTGE